MALVQCADCSASVSDAAPACPKCGRPMATAPIAVREKAGFLGQSGTAWGAANLTCLMLLLAAGAFVVMMLVFSQI